MKTYSQIASEILINRKGLIQEYADKENSHVMQLVDVIKRATSELEHLRDSIVKRRLDVEEVFQYLRKEGYALVDVTDMYGDYLYKERNLS